MPTEPTRTAAEGRAEGPRSDERTWRGNRDPGRHPHAGQARAHHGRRQQPLDRLGHRQGHGGAGRVAGLHLSGRRTQEAGRAAGGRGRVQARAALRRDRQAPRWTRCLPSSGRQWGKLDFLVHAIAFSDKAELDGRYVDTTEKNFTQTMLISCFSFTALAQRAEKLMSAGGVAADAHLLRRREGHAALQRDGRGEGGAGGLRALSRGRPRHATASASTPSRRGRSRRWPPPASPTSATSCSGTSTTRRCAAR